MWQAGSKGQTPLALRQRSRFCRRNYLRRRLASFIGLIFVVLFRSVLLVVGFLTDGEFGRLIRGKTGEREREREVGQR